MLDTEEGLSEFPHVIVNQARMLTFLREHMERSAGRLRPYYGLQAADVQIDETDSSEHPVTVTLRHLENGAETGRTSTIRAKYVVGCDGARSSIRTAIGRELVGDPMNQSWGVMDVLAVTDFPDIRLKSAIHSANQGNILIIPREGGYMVRLYIELDAVGDREMLESRSITPEKLTAVANRILAPYTLDVATSAGGRSTRSASGSATGSTTCRRPRRPTGSPGSSSPATPATPTAPRPARA